MKIFPDDWTVAVAKDVCSQIVDCVNKTAPVADRETGYKMIRTTNVRNGRVDLSDARHVEEGVYRKWTRRIVPKRGDVILTREAPLGEVGLLRSDETVFLGQRTMIYRANEQDLDQWFLYYSLLGPVLQGQLRTLGSGSTVEHIRVPDAETVEIPLPPLHAQRKIAAVLSAYDDLIENNRRRIALLEQMAEEMYREWFVRLRFPGHEQTRIIKGVPEGWSLRPFSQVVSIKPTERIDRHESRPYVGMGDLSLTSMYFKQQEYRAGGSGSRFRNGDTLFPRITPSLENGKRGYVQSLEEGEVGLGSTEFIVMRERELGAEHIYLLTCSSAFRKHAEQSMVGASGRQRVHENCFDFFMVKTPSETVRGLFKEVIKPYFDKIKMLARRNDLLIEARNLLLPRLISGKLHVDDLDIQLPPSMVPEVTPDSTEEEPQQGELFHA